MYSMNKSAIGILLLGGTLGLMVYYGLCWLLGNPVDIFPSLTDEFVSHNDLAPVLLIGYFVIFLDKVALQYHLANTQVHQHNVNTGQSEYVSVSYIFVLIAILLTVFAPFDKSISKDPIAVVLCLIGAVVGIIENWKRFAWLLWSGLLLPFALLLVLLFL